MLTSDTPTFVQHPYKVTTLIQLAVYYRLSTPMLRDGVFPTNQVNLVTSFHCVVSVFFFCYSLSGFALFNEVTRRSKEDFNDTTLQFESLCFYVQTIFGSRGRVHEQQRITVENESSFSNKRTVWSD